MQARTGRAQRLFIGALAAALKTFGGVPAAVPIGWRVRLGLVRGRGDLNHFLECRHTGEYLLRAADA